MINYTKLVEKAAPRIKQEREHLGLEKKEVAAELGYGLSNYSSYETKTLPSLERAVELAQYFGCSVDYLLGLSDTREPQQGPAGVDVARRISKECLDHYRDSIPRKAFIEAMEQIAGKVPDRAPAPGISCPGIEIIKRPDITAGELADLLSGCCPPFCGKDGLVYCDDHSCRACWLAWLTTGEPPRKGGEPSA